MNADNVIKEMQKTLQELMDCKATGELSFKMQITDGGIRRFEVQRVDVLLGGRNNRLN